MVVARNSKSMISDYGAHVPEDKDQFLVVTPYGDGLVVRTRRHQGENGGDDAAGSSRVVMREIELTSWKSASESSVSSSSSGRPVRPTTLFSPTDFPSVPVTVGSDVLCLYGRGRVVELRGDDNRVVAVVRLSSWRLAHRSLVTCYLDVSAVRVVRQKHVYEMSVAEKVERAVELKAVAATQFNQKDYAKALHTYARAVDAVKFVQHKPDSSNAVRADLLVVMITCSNNAATCCSKLEQWDDAYKHAQQAISLLDALEAKKGLKIHRELHREGHHDVRVFGEWKVKSLMILARVLAEKDEIEAAMAVAKKAREVLVMYTTSPEFAENDAYKQSVKQLLSNDKELLKLYARCKERRKAQLKKEKLRAQAMFATAAIPKDRASSPEEKKSEATSAPNEASLETPPPNAEVVAAAEDEEPSEAPRSVPLTKGVLAQTDDDEDGEDIAWHKDPFFLGGLGVLLGTIGTLMLLSQLTRQKS